MKTLVALALITFLAIFSSHAQPADYPALKAEAEKLFADKSYAKANEVYLKAKALTLSADDARWVEFRLADTQWRSAAASQQADTTKQEQAYNALQVMTRDIKRAEDKDRVWVEAMESMGDYWWMRKNSANWHPGWASYQQALDWWAGTKDVELARERYLSIVRRAAKPVQTDRWYYYGYYGNYVPLPTLENALKIAQTDNDKALMHYLIGMTIKNQGGSFEQRQRVPEEFEAAVKFGKGNDWYDDALYHYAEWMIARAGSSRRRTAVTVRSQITRRRWNCSASWWRNSPRVNHAILSRHSSRSTASRECSCMSPWGTSFCPVPRCSII